MAEYIDRENAIAWFMPYAHAGESIDADVVISDIKGMKAADVAPVVRCKDCKYYCQEKINGVICRHPALDFDTECFDHWINTNPDDFCSQGERKEGAE